MNPVVTVRDATYAILRAQGVTTVFGNPGSNELPFLANFPSDFHYILALHEGVAVAMADAYAQVTRKPSLVNLHAAAGTGNGMGALVNAWSAHSPIVVMAGQQTRSMVGMEAFLTIIEPTTLARPLVKLTHVPANAQDVPLQMSRALHMSMLPTPRPVYLAVPYDDWSQEADPQSGELADRTVSEAGLLDEETFDRLVARLEAATNPVLVFGADVDTAGANADAVVLAEKLKAPVWVAPLSARCPFPTTHFAYRGRLPASIADISRLLSGHDLIVVFGAPVFRYHQYYPGNYLPQGASLIAVTQSDEEASRAPVGDTIVGDVGGILRKLSSIVTPVERPVLRRLARPAPAPREALPIRPDALFDIIADVAPRDAIFVDESSSTLDMMWERLPLEEPCSYFFGAGGGLGYGMPAAVGVQLACPSRRVIAIIGDGAANYSITALWTAARYKIPVVFIILKNEAYAALKWFASVMKVEGVPGLDVPGIDFISLARGYGVGAVHAERPEDIAAALRAALASESPTLIEIATAVVI